MALHTIKLYYNAGINFLVFGMAKRYTIVASTADVASVNIRDCLFSITKWEKAYEGPKFRAWRQGAFDLVEMDDYHVFSDGLDRELQEAGLRPEVIVFASKHRSKENRKTLTVHHTGNFGEAKFGGRPGELAVAAPVVAASLLRSLNSSVTPFSVSYEATHHGPSDISIPSVYVEIGSTIEEWKDKDAGMVVARAILAIDEEQGIPVYVGIGGNHYAPRETSLTIETGAAFGHIIADHVVSIVTEDTLRQAMSKSGTEYAYVDRKSIPRDQRERIEKMITDLGYEMHTEAEIKSLTISPWMRCQRLMDIALARKLKPRPQFTEAIRAKLGGCSKDSCASCPFGQTLEASDDLLCMAWKVDRDRVKKAMSETRAAYFYKEDGCPSGVLVGVNADELKADVGKLTERCIDILRQKYDVKYDSLDETLHVIDKRFDPEKAKALGVEEGPMFGRLAKGVHVWAKGIEVTPEMVFTEKVVRIKLNNYSYNIDSGYGAMEPGIFSPKASRVIDSKGEIIDSEEHAGRIIDGESAVSGPEKVGDTDEDIMRVMQELKTNVLVIGCGGGGSNSISRMAMEGITGAKLFALNTDAQHLLHTKADKKFLIGKKLTRGFGAGSIPEIGEGAAKESLGEIKASISTSDMVFVTCGLGGGTGTGSAPVVAQAAKEAGALTIAVVTMPFKVEGAVRRRNADAGLHKLREAADTVIVVPNDKLLEVVPDLPLQKAFKVADEVLTHAVKGITELVTKPGLVNLDFADVKTVMTNGGVAMIGLGIGRGENRAEESVKDALQSPLLDINITNAKAAIVNVVGGEDMSVSEAEGIVEKVFSSIDPDARLIWGANIDPEMEDTIRTMVIITDVKSPQILGKPVVSKQQETAQSKKFGIDFIM